MTQIHRVLFILFFVWGVQWVPVCGTSESTEESVTNLRWFPHLSRSSILDRIQTYGERRASRQTKTDQMERLPPGRQEVIVHQVGQTVTEAAKDSLKPSPAVPSVKPPSPTPVISPSPTPVISPSPTPVISPFPTPVISPSPSPEISPSPSPEISLEPAITPEIPLEPAVTPEISPSPEISPVLSPLPASKVDSACIKEAIEEAVASAEAPVAATESDFVEDVGTVLPSPSVYIEEPAPAPSPSVEAPAPSPSLEASAPSPSLEESDSKPSVVTVPVEMSTSHVTREKTSEQEQSVSEQSTDPAAVKLHRQSEYERMEVPGKGTPSVSDEASEASEEPSQIHHHHLGHTVKVVSIALACTCLGVVIIGNLFGLYYSYLYRPRDIDISLLD